MPMVFWFVENVPRKCQVRQSIDVNKNQQVVTFYFSRLKHMLLLSMVKFDICVPISTKTKRFSWLLHAKRDTRVYCVCVLYIVSYHCCIFLFFIKKIFCRTLQNIYLKKYIICTLWYIHECIYYSIHNLSSLSSAWRLYLIGVYDVPNVKREISYFWVHTYLKFYTNNDD